MKGLALVAAAAAAAFTGLASAGPALSLSQQERRADGGNSAEDYEGRIDASFDNACLDVGIPWFYCQARAKDGCKELHVEAVSRLRQGGFDKFQLEYFKVEFEKCFRNRDPATEAGLCCGLGLSKHLCHKYAMQCRKEMQPKLDPSRGTTQDVVTSMVRGCLEDMAEEEGPLPPDAKPGQSPSGPGAAKPARQGHGGYRSTCEQGRMKATYRDGIFFSED
ncbi:uncharacterized protein MAM_02434 [Metarhizium album ARSEF 1941]|uniref:Uncharacterized protein n=1 Tax=Metarhizium album (strain ARSEF 1941) TaxID=1081103 RepID=A0A0B2WU31_METAS|nr:uncharacterized protein MAM_02434 [Metarhizium album ARSEF 1941]KHN99581.1 hypothetical protein MAM_02434 [Metarhizium album ARSEF 1941]